ncbi:MAG: hypothetical protein A3G32_02070 [Deltaproteobacteria bacterium RIFCSPLOWO2_12_FULL_40_28]|nr:MAG: hypothetical protein A3C45_04375 [Deltaproteobacteria bacterium RIFCSPHIGHO2_02_FULL_40_28]OGQ21118.1 MAG: hypothetical protein A3E27_05135 [Deltaproteobacteria bacterium RIFCSPHIGHO2_12_FULL_40_32]OGQ39035.1 MAG: hypothetical protein A3I69_06800 [Deltaproteobacteria bacterium RIFCSPLOWO2_02_FULL_40_36]OGQ53083.1 MAG: hypothetical protein A3G32_02070 [Deltaproteobacteria bacterium RIFCSPLOWO2_12_FULL_40_28]
MKRVIFVSKSRLSWNLLCTVVGLVPSRVELFYAEDPETLASMPKGVKPFHLLLVDWNIFEGATSYAARFWNHPSFSNAHKILLYAHKKNPDENKLREVGFISFHEKPLLVDELKALIMQETKHPLKST